MCKYKIFMLFDKQAPIGDLSKFQMSYCHGIVDQLL